MNNWLSRFFGKKNRNKEKESPLDNYYFKKIIVKDKTPNNKDLKDGEFIEVIYKGKSYWAIFKCPCGCENVISLPLQNTHKPSWNLSLSINKRPTLFPSIWQNKGCLSHFWIEDGKIKWCSNSGVEPWIAEPEYYQKPRM